MSNDIREKFNSATTPHRYDNMINIPRPKQRRPMAMVNRAAQFSAFAALTGYDEIVENTATKRTNEENKIDVDYIYDDMYIDVDGE